MTDASVPCDGCTLCCKGDAIRLLPGDSLSSYETEPHDKMLGHLMLAHKPNGDCVYLEENGCGIHSRRPRMCREMDCRNIVRMIPSKKKAVKLGCSIEVWKRGKQLLKAER